MSQEETSTPKSLRRGRRPKKNADLWFIPEGGEFFRLLVDHSDYGIVVVDKGGLIRFINPAAAQLWGRTPEEMVGQLFAFPVSNQEVAELEIFYPRKQSLIIEMRAVKLRWQGDTVFLASLRDITERRKAEKELYRIGWLLKKSLKVGAENREAILPSYGDISKLNTRGMLKNNLDENLLLGIASNILELLGTSVTIFEKNGDYVLDVTSLSWCRFLDEASFKRCGTADLREALTSGRWLCRESCWSNVSKVAIDTRQPVDIECHGGIRSYAVPIIAGGEVIGSFNFGYGNPPQDPRKLAKIAEKYGLRLEELLKQARAFESRPPFILELAKHRLSNSAELLGEVVNRRRAEAELKQTLEALRLTLVKTVGALVTALEKRDPYTAGHQKRVAQLASAIAQEMGLAEEKVAVIRLAAVIHDVGKIVVPAEILAKPTQLVEPELNLIKSHSQAGSEILADLDFHCPIAQIVLQHHERLDGSGYPQGLAGPDILPEARILAVADVVEAMSSHRPYRAALGVSKALEEIAQNKGILYDPEVVEACLRLFREKEFNFG